MTTYKLTLTGAELPIEQASVLLTDVLFPAAGAVSLTKDDDTRDAGAAWKLEAYFEDRPDGAALGALLDECGLGATAIEELPDTDWVAHALAGLGLVEAGRFILYGSHDADKLPADDKARIPILIEANQAFGTGHHPTTAGCLTLLDRFAGAPPQAVFDLGCGSAVLAIAAAKLWDVEVIASDIDEKSVEIARGNIALNGVDDLVTAIAADGFGDPRIRVRAPFDFVFANILAGPLIEFAPAMAAHIGPRGRLMLAGLMAGQEESVRETYQTAGFRQINRLEHAVWPVLLFVRL